MNRIIGQIRNSFEEMQADIQGNILADIPAHITDLFDHSAIWAQEVPPFVDIKGQLSQSLRDEGQA
jgi:hypothetical protein